MTNNLKPNDVGEESITTEIKNKSTKTVCESITKRKLSWIKKSEIIHNNKYDYSNVEYFNNKIKVKILCLNHGYFYQRPDSHYMGHGCSLCKGENLTKLNAKSKNKFVEDAINVHGNLYDYSKVNYISGHRKVEMICKKHGSFCQTPNCHIVLNHGCPKCKLSKGESKIIKFLEYNKIEYITQKTFDNFRNRTTNKMFQYDFYIPSKNVLIEYDGKQHFKLGYVGNHKITEKELKEIQRRDSIKSDYAYKNGIKLVRIKYTNLKNIEEILKSELI